MNFSDFQHGRKPIPYTRKEYESWAKEREVGQSKFVRNTVVATGIAFALIGTVAVGSLLWFSNRPVPNSWPLLVVVPVLGIGAFGSAMGWFISKMIWSVSEARFGATNPADLDDENLETGRKEQNWIAISGIPFLLGSVAVLLVPEKYASVGFVGIGITMTWFGYIALSSKVEPANNSETVSRPKIWFIFLLGIAVFVIATYFTLMAAFSPKSSG